VFFSYSKNLSIIYFNGSTLLTINPEFNRRNVFDNASDGNQSFSSGFSLKLIVLADES